MSHPLHVGSDASHRQREQPREATGLSLDVSSVSATGEPVSIEEAEDFLRLSNPQYDLLQMLITSVRREAEDIARRNFTQRETTARWDEAFEKVELPRPPTADINSVEYYDKGDDKWESIDGADYSKRENVLTIDGGNDGRPLRVKYIAGYSDLPEGLKLQMLRDVRFAYDHRDAGAEGSARVQDRGLYAQYRPY